MNKKANVGLVILSVVALFAIGGLAVMFKGGATGAVQAQVFSVSNNIIIVNPEGKMQFKFDQSSGTGNAKAHEGYFTIDDVPILESGLGFAFDTWSNSDAGGIDIQTDVFDLQWILPSFGEGLQDFKFDSNMNKGKLEFTFSQLQALQELQGDVIAECAQCDVKVEGLTLLVKIPEPVKEFRFGIIPVVPPPQENVVIQFGGIILPSVVNVASGTQINVENQDAVIHSLQCPVLGFHELINPTETVSFIATASDICVDPTTSNTLTINVI
jgi:hypothetical protein